MLHAGTPSCVIKKQQKESIANDMATCAKQKAVHLREVKTLSDIVQDCCTGLQYPRTESLSYNGDAQVATAVATSSWVAAVQHLLSNAPVTPDDVQLWLHLLPLVRTLLATHSVQPSALQLLALSLQQAAVPVLESKQGAQAAPSLPLALTSHADAAGMFTGARLQLQGIELTQVRMWTSIAWSSLQKCMNTTAAVDSNQRIPACLSDGCCQCTLLWAGVVSRQASKACIDAFWVAKAL